ncbi:hypothetical protein CTI12_AA083030 [Artemisia annua]|uniref:Helitron helicase-like domain-containing protein n=1 Tax=Artemisia annua TaxID=35608 RepID=A0A2U1PW04_ARTAN|nr:hypothetical protein CTI12_AA083030 [Artemisia annua]
MVILIDSKHSVFFVSPAEAGGSDTHDAFQVPAAGSFVCSPRPQPAILIPQARPMAANGALPPACPSASPTASNVRILKMELRACRCAPRRRQPRTCVAETVPVDGNRGPPDTYVSVGPCDRVCRHCKARFWYEERLKHGSARFPEYHRCCMGGKLVLRPQAEYPPYIRQLFMDRHFMENIRAYNNMFAMTSLGAHVDDSVNRGAGPYFGHWAQCIEFEFVVIYPGLYNGPADTVLRKT